MAILTCHNRRALTRRCLSSLAASCESAGIDAVVTLVDDGSTDGTSETVRRDFPFVKIIPADGSLFWAKGMALAEKYALAQGMRQGDYLLWLNDDVELYLDAIEVLLKTDGQTGTGVVVGSVCLGPESDQISYSGLKRTSVRKFGFRKVAPTGSSEYVDSFNGNVVLLSFDAHQAIGRIEGRYAHALADIDYGLRAVKAGHRPILAGTSVGWCAPNSPVPTESLWPAWKRHVSLTSAFHPSSYALFLRKHDHRLWPLRFIASYFRWWIGQLGKTFPIFAGSRCSPD